VPVVDPSGFHIAAQLVTERGVFPLRVGGAQQRGQSMFLGEGDQDILDVPVVERVSIDLNFGMVGTVSADVYAPFEISRAVLNSELFRIGNLLQVQIGYPSIGMYLPWFSGMTTKPSFRLDPQQGLTATITTQIGAFTAVRNSRSTVWEGRSYADIISEIADFPSNRWNVELPDDDKSGDVDPLYRQRAQVSQANQADWPFIYHLARTAGCEAALIYTAEQENKPTLRIRRRSEMFGGEPIYTFVMWGQIDMVNRFPLLNFETSGEGVWMPRGNAPIRYGDWNPDTQEEAGGSVTQEDRASKNQRLQEETLGVGTSEQLQGTETTVSGMSEEGRFLPARSAERGRDGEDDAGQEADEDSCRGGITCTFSSVGLPFVFPGDLVRVLGVGDFFDGNYLVQGLGHEAAAGDWNMNFKCLTNAPGGPNAITRALAQQWPDPNRQESPDRDEPGSGPSTDRNSEGTE